MENNNSYQDPSLPRKAEKDQSETIQSTSEIVADYQPANDVVINEPSSTYGADGDAQSGIVLSPRGMKNLRRAASWAKFLSIFYFVVLGLLFLLGIFMVVMGGTYGNAVNIGTGALYIVCSIISAIAAYTLFSFAQKAKRACDKADSMSLEESMDRLSFLYQYMGVLSIVYIVFIVLAVIISVITAVVAGG